MPIDLASASEQLAEHITDRLNRIGDAYIAPGWPFWSADSSSWVTGRLDAATERCIAELAGGDAGAAVTVMTTVWPAGADVPLDWWATPLGTLTMLAGNDVVSQAMAARALGVSPQRVAQLVAKGRLATVGDHVSTVSLRARLGLR